MLFLDLQFALYLLTFTFHRPRAVPAPIDPLSGLRLLWPYARLTRFLKEAAPRTVSEPHWRS